VSRIALRSSARVVRDAVRPGSGPAELLDQLTRQAKGQVETADPGPGLASQVPKPCQRVEALQAAVAAPRRASSPLAITMSACAGWAAGEIDADHALCHAPDVGGAPRPAAQVRTLDPATPRPGLGVWPAVCARQSVLGNRAGPLSLDQSVPGMTDTALAQATFVR